MSEFKRTVNNRLSAIEDHIREYNIVNYPEIIKDLVTLAKNSKALKELVSNNFKFMREYNKAINFLLIIHTPSFKLLISKISTNTYDNYYSYSNWNYYYSFR